MPFMAYNKLLIVEEPIHNRKVGETIVGYEFKLQYPSYRGTFLSCIEDLKISVDDEPVEKSRIYFFLNGKWFLLDELKDCFKEYWYVMDFATIRVMQAGGLPQGEHKIRVYMKHRIPYTGYFGQYLILDADESKVLSME
ncbi:MAG: DUF6379 domain-containing protein [Clostridiales bacterium]|nr:DUF6379 domain-containing protein [Clostridiales bacterium]